MYYCQKSRKQIEFSTVLELRDKLNELIEEGYASSVALVYEHEALGWEQITSIEYGGGYEEIKLLSEDLSD